MIVEIAMRAALLKQILEVQTTSGKEDKMVEFILAYCAANGYDAYSDEHKNVYITKGEAAWYPAIGAHSDTVQDLSDVVEVRGETGDRFVGYVRGTEYRHGIGADDKTGIFVCLELLARLPVLKVCFFAQEEVGCVGASNASSAFFSDIGYFIEFDCPSRNMMSYTSSGVRLFDNDGPFIHKALPVLTKYAVKWQRHPYTDVCVVRPRFGMSCLNMSSGYYNWHQTTEIVYLPDVANAISTGVDLIEALGVNVNYPFRGDDAPPLVAVTGLAVESIV